MNSDFLTHMIFLIYSDLHNRDLTPMLGTLKFLGEKLMEMLSATEMMQNNPLPIGQRCWVPPAV